MASAVLVDSTVFIDHLQNHRDAVAYLAPLLANDAVVLHPAVLVEVLSGARNSPHLRALDAALRGIRVLKVRGDDFVRTADLLRAYLLSSGIGWPDCLIAATALRLGIPVATVNDKHFRAVRGLKVIRPY